MSSIFPATSVYEFTVTSPAGTPATSPTVVATSMPTGQLVHFEIVIPKGHSGLTGIQLRVAGGQIYPLTRGQWFIGDDRTISQDVSQVLDSGAWQTYLYNTGIYSHSWQVKYSIIDTSHVATPDELAPIASPIII